MARRDCLRALRATIRGIRTTWLARAVIIGQLLFTAGWIAGGWLQNDVYSCARHDINDLGARTAQFAWVWLVLQGVTGALTMAFAIGALRPALSSPGQREPVSAWVLAFSLIGFDNLAAPFLRLDCRAADQGCTPGIATASWQADAHIVIAAIGSVLMLVAPFALERRFRITPRFKDLAKGASTVGALLAASAVAYITLNGMYGQGLAQRAGCVLVSASLIVLARRVEAAS